MFFTPSAEIPQQTKKQTALTRIFHSIIETTIKTNKYSSEIKLILFSKSNIITNNKKIIKEVVI